MARYIDADKLIERVNASCAFPNMGQDGYFLRDCIIDIISKQPTADVEEVKRGKWQTSGNKKKCSLCEFIYYSNNDEWNYCPNCGAKMDKTKKGN